MLVLAQPALPPDEGLSRLAALLVAAGIAYAAIMLHQWWQERKIQISSPTPPRGGGHDGNPQVGDGVTDDDTTDDTDDDTVSDHGLRRIRLADGSLLKRRVAAVWSTGSSRLPEDAEPADEDEDQGADEVSGEPRAKFADRLVAMPVRYADAVRDIRRAYGVSERTAKRDLAEAAKRNRAAD